MVVVCGVCKRLAVEGVAWWICDDSNESQGVIFEWVNNGRHTTFYKYL